MLLLIALPLVPISLAAARRVARRVHFCRSPQHRPALARRSRVDVAGLSAASVLVVGQLAVPQRRLVALEAATAAGRALPDPSAGLPLRAQTDRAAAAEAGLGADLAVERGALLRLAGRRRAAERGCGRQQTGEALQAQHGGTRRGRCTDRNDQLGAAAGLYTDL